MGKEQDTFLAQLKIFMIQHLPKGNLSLETAAQNFDMTSRTFQRQLSKLNLKFSILLDLARKELALEFMKDLGINLSELTFLLDFADLTSFQRAFKRWYGITPRQYRRNNV